MTNNERAEQFLRDLWEQWESNGGEKVNEYNPVVQVNEFAHWVMTLGLDLYGHYQSSSASK